MTSLRPTCGLVFALLLACQVNAQESRQRPVIMQIFSYPDSSEVFIDGIDMGRTPLRLEENRLGIRHITVQREGYAAYRDSANMGSQDTVTVLARLLRMGYLSVLTDPPGVAIILDEIPRGFTPRILSGIEPGQHRLRLELKDYQNTTRQIVVPEGDSVSVNVSMTSAYGTFTLRADSPTSLILLDGDSVGVGTIVDYKLSTGMHDVEIVDPKHPPAVRQRIFMGSASRINLRARMGEKRFDLSFGTVLVPGGVQIRDGSLVEGFSLAIGSGVTFILLVREMERFFSERSSYNVLRSDYLKATSEKDAQQLHYSLAQKYSTVLKHRNLGAGLGVLLGAFLTYHVIDVYLNHATSTISTNILEAEPSAVGLRLDYSRSQAVLTASITF